MTEAAVTLHTLSERELDVVERALAIASESLEFYQLLEARAFPLREASEQNMSSDALGRDMRQLLLKIQAGR